MAVDWRVQKGDGYCIDFPTKYEADEYLKKEQAQGYLEGYEVVKFEYESTFEECERLRKEKFTKEELELIELVANLGIENCDCIINNTPAWHKTEKNIVAEATKPKLEELLEKVRKM